jgi:parallel beta-helix repeat protein
MPSIRVAGYNGSWGQLTIPKLRRLRFVHYLEVKPLFLMGKISFRFRVLAFLGLLLSLFSCLCADPPVVTLSPSGPLTTDFGLITVTANASDIDGDALSYSWSFQTLPASLMAPPDLNITSGAFASTAAFTLTSEGTYTLQVIVDDLDGSSATQSSRLLQINAVFSQTFFVSNSGDDSTAIPEISLERPLKTLDHALSLVGAGDTVILLPDSVQSPTPTTFQIGTAQLNATGSQENPILISGQSENLITLRPLGVNTGMRLIEQSFITLRNLNFDGFSNVAIEITSGSDIRLENCRISSSGIGVSLNSSERTTITNSQFIANTTGVQLQDSSDNTISLSIFTKNQEYGYRQVFLPPDRPSSHNTVRFSTFYDNGRTFDNSVHEAAIHLGNNSSNTLEFNIFLNNIKDFASDHLFQTSINRNISFLNLGIQADSRFLPEEQTAFFPVTDPFLKNPETGDFSLLQGSPAAGAGPGGSNFGAIQSIPQPFPTLRTWFVDFDVANTSFLQTGGSGAPFQSINQALREASPGDKVLVVPSQQKSYTLDLDNLKHQVPGWGSIAIEGKGAGSVFPSLSCLQNGEATLEIKNRAFLEIRKMVLRGFKNAVPDSCSIGLHILGSRHLRLDRLYIHGHADNGIVVDSSQGIHLTSTVIFDNTVALNIKNTQTRNQHNTFDKLTLSANLGGISVAQSHATSIRNSIIFGNANSHCLNQDANNPPTEFSIRFTLCNQPGVIDPLFNTSNSFNLLGSGTGFDPLFRSNDPEVQRTRPYEAFLLSSANAAASIALNAGDPSYPIALTQPEFSEPLNTTLPVEDLANQQGAIDLGAFEQAKTDVDGDGLNNDLEILVGLDTNSAGDALDDPDQDGLSNLDELSLHGTSISTADTDQDGFSDGIEVSIGSDPLTDDADQIRTLIPKPLILPHETVLPPAIFMLDGIDQNGRPVLNIWKLLQGPVPEEEFFLDNTNSSLTILAKQDGTYTLGLDQKLLSGTSGSLTLQSLEDDRDITTVTIEDLPPIPVLPPDVSTTFSPGRILYFYGSPEVTKNPSFDPNGAPILTYEWVLLGPKNPPPNLIDFSSPTPFMVLTDRSAIYEFKLKISSSGSGGFQTTISNSSFLVSVTGSGPSLPRANAGLDSFGLTQSTLALSGLGSGDQEQSQLTWYWKQVSGPVVQFLRPSFCFQEIFEPSATSLATTPCSTSPVPEFAATSPGVVEFELVVSKNGGETEIFSEPDKVVVTIDSTTNAVPVASILPVESVEVQSPIALNGSNSFDRRAFIDQSFSTQLSYRWIQETGSAIYLQNTTAPTLNFHPLETGFYEFSLQVADNQGLWSKKSKIRLAVDSASTKLPIAQAGTDQIGLIRRFIILDGSESLGGSKPILNYFWNQIAGPEDVELPGLSTPTVAFQPTQPGRYSFTLRVSSEDFTSVPDEVSVVINSDEQSIPVANAGNSQTVALSTVVILDGSASFDRDNDGLIYFWQQVSGIPVILSKPTSTVTTFFASQPGISSFALVVNDGKSSSDPSYIAISVLKQGEQAPQGSLQPFDPTTILDSDAQGGGCFIVSASFGSQSLPVRFFTGFRDRILLNIPGGKSIMNTYYQCSPPLASVLRKHPRLRNCSQIALVTLILFMVGFPIFLIINLAQLLRTRLF